MNRLLMLLPVLLVMLFGCAGRGRQADSAQYDLGASENASGRIAYLRAVNVKAPPWLDTPAMEYRLDYMHSTERKFYAESRWVAPPGMLIEHLLRQNLLGAKTSAGECALQVDLDEFIQTFADARSSQAKIRLRATLLAPRGGVPLAGSTFTIAHDAASADAVGGVAAHVAAVRDLTIRLQSWLAQVGEDPQRASAQCASGKM